MKLVDFLKRKYGQFSAEMITPATISALSGEISLDHLTAEDLDEYLDAREEELVRKISQAIRSGLSPDKEINGLPKVNKRKV